MNLTVREMTLADIPKIVDYFLLAESDYLKGMGADKLKLPKREDWINKLIFEHDQDYQNKSFYYIIWEINGQAIGHTNINNIDFGETAVMHLHIWKPSIRAKGIGKVLLLKSIPYYFKNFNLKNIKCEPYALNSAPNKVLTKVGFQFIKKYETIPGWINFKQEVNSYLLKKGDLLH